MPKCDWCQQTIGVVEKDGRTFCPIHRKHFDGFRKNGNLKAIATRDKAQGVSKT